MQVFSSPSIAHRAGTTVPTTGFLAPFLTAWRFRELIRAVIRQELAARFSGSMFGWGWAIVGPLVTLGLYTLTFSSALRLPVTRLHGGIANYALWVFGGLIVFNLFAELAYRAPTLLHEHASRIKTSIFPCEVLAWIVLLRTGVSAGISLGVLLVFQLVLTGRIHATIVLLPLLLLPLGLLMLGLVWFLAAIGAFARDVAHLMITIVPLGMMISPIFYRVADIPDSMQTIAYLNPLTGVIETMRAMVLGGAWPSAVGIVWLVLLSLVVFRAGHAFFDRYRGILVDVI